MRPCPLSLAQDAALRGLQPQAGAHCLRICWLRSDLAAAGAAVDRQLSLGLPMGLGSLHVSPKCVYCGLQIEMIL